MIQQTTNLEFRFPKDVMNVMHWEQSLVINDEEDNSISIHGVPQYELYYLMRNVTNKLRVKDIKEHHKHLLKETYENIGKYLETLENKDEDNNEG